MDCSQICSLKTGNGKSVGRKNKIPSSTKKKYHLNVTNRVIF